jgi:hypothetical protein
MACKENAFAWSAVGRLLIRAKCDRYLLRVLGRSILSRAAANSKYEKKI